MLLWVLRHAALILAFALIAFGAGRAIVWRFLPPIARGQRIAMAFALGSALIAQSLFVLGAVGALTRGNVLLVLALASIVGCIPVGAAALAVRSDRWSAVVLGVVLMGTVPAFFLALYPPVGFDATSYHLPFARLFAEAGALVFAETLRFPVFPQLGELLFTGALLVADDVTAQLTQWLALVVTSIATASLARDLAGRAASVLAVALWLGTPLAVFLGANAYIDASLTMYVTLAFAAFHAWNRDGHVGWAALAGAFAGCAAATKYHGIFFVIVLVAAFARRNARSLAVFMLVAATFAAPWYARIADATGNPVFPYLSAVFGRHEWQTVVDRRIDAAVTQIRSGDRTVIATPNEVRDPLIASPEDRNARHRGVFERAVLDRTLQGTAPHNPWIVILIPFALVAATVDRRQRLPIAAAFAYALIVWTLDWRFLIVIVPVLSIAIATGITAMVVERRATTSYAAFALAAPGLIWATLLLADRGPIPVRGTERDQFLSREILVYDSLRFAARTRGLPVIYLLGGENGMYYCPSRCLGGHYGPWRNQLVSPLAANPALLAETLRRDGVDVLVIERKAESLMNLTPSGEFRRIFSTFGSEAWQVPRHR